MQKSIILKYFCIEHRYVTKETRRTAPYPASPYRASLPPRRFTQLTLSFDTKAPRYIDAKFC